MGILFHFLLIKVGAVSSVHSILHSIFYFLFFYFFIFEKKKYIRITKKHLQNLKILLQSLCFVLY